MFAKLNAVAAEIDECDGTRAGGLRLVDEVAERAAQRILIEIARAGDVEAGGLERLRDQPGIIGGRGERTALIGGVADDKRDARFGACTAWRKNGRPSLAAVSNQSNTFCCIPR